MSGFFEDEDDWCFDCGGSPCRCAFGPDDEDDGWVLNPDERNDLWDTDANSPSPPSPGAVDVPNQSTVSFQGDKKP